MASNIEVASYDPKKVNLVMNGKIITGFASDSMITIARNEDTVTTQVGVQPTTSPRTPSNKKYLSANSQLTSPKGIYF